MSKYGYGKLVRDHIPAQIKRQGLRPVVLVLPRQERGPALFQKVLEEAQEVVAARSVEKKFLEIADLLEVVDALCRHYGVSRQELRAVQTAKRRDKGSFNQGFFLRKVFGTRRAT